MKQRKLIRHSLDQAFKLALRGGFVVGFVSVGICIGTLLTLILVFKRFFQPFVSFSLEHNYALMFELIAGFGLGGSSMALFGRVGGGIYTKAADVGADLVGKIEAGLDEDSPRNPATIADNVGDNVGDIAGMGSDLFGSLSESTCAALVIFANSLDITSRDLSSLYYSLLISAVGIVSSFFSSLVGLYGYRLAEFSQIATSLNLQLYLTSGISLILLFPITYFLPPYFIYEGATAYSYYAYICTASGLISGLLIGVSTDHYTSYRNPPVREMANSCSSGAAINIIYGLSLGYISTVIPVLLIATTALIAICLLGMLGVALASLGMLSTLCTALAIDVYGPISDNAGGIVEMSSLGGQIRKITDALDSAGNTTAAIGKGFAIGSAALVSLALYGAFITRAMAESVNPIKNIQIINPWLLFSLIIGAMLPYAFSALTMKAVGEAAKEMVEEVRLQFRDPMILSGDVEPDYQRCIKVSTNASLKMMIVPGLLVILTPIVLGTFFHSVLVAGLLPGALLSGLQMAISMANTGCAWDNTKKFIESGQFVNEHGEVRMKGSDEHRAAVIGDTVGDPMKDTSGPSLNILIKLMAIISLVFAGSFTNTSFLAKYLKIEQHYPIP